MRSRHRKREEEHEAMKKTNQKTKHLTLQMLGLYSVYPSTGICFRCILTSKISLIKPHMASILKVTTNMISVRINLNNWWVFVWRTWCLAQNRIIIRREKRVNLVKWRIISSSFSIFFTLVRLGHHLHLSKVYKWIRRIGKLVFQRPSCVSDWTLSWSMAAFPY